MIRLKLKNFSVAIFTLILMSQFKKIHSECTGSHYYFTNDINVNAVVSIKNNNACHDEDNITIRPGQANFEIYSPPTNNPACWFGDEECLLRRIDIDLGTDYGSATLNRKELSSEYIYIYKSLIEPDAIEIGLPIGAPGADAQKGELRILRIKRKSITITNDSSATIVPVASNLNLKEIDQSKDIPVIPGKNQQPIKIDPKDLGSNSKNVSFLSSTLSGINVNPKAINMPLADYFDPAKNSGLWQSPSVPINYNNAQAFYVAAIPNKNYPDKNKQLRPSDPIILENEAKYTVFRESGSDKLSIRKEE